MTNCEQQSSPLLTGGARPELHLHGRELLGGQVQKQLQLTHLPFLSALLCYPFGNYLHQSLSPKEKEALSGCH